MERLFSFPVTEVDAAELAHQDRIHASLTDAVRRLCDAQLRTTIPVEEIADIIPQVDAIAQRLLRSARDGSFGMELDHTGGGREHGNAVLGIRNPFAAAVGEHAMFWHDDSASATLELGALYEGPPGCVHGGVIALLMDQLFTEAAAAAGQLGMTASITVSYRRPVPLGQVTVAARLERIDGAKRMLRGTLCDAAGNVAAEAEALLILPRSARDGEVPVWPKRPPVAIAPETAAT